MTREFSIDILHASCRRRVLSSASMPVRRQLPHSLNPVFMSLLDQKPRNELPLPLPPHTHTPTSHPSTLFLRLMSDSRTLLFSLYVGQQQPFAASALFSEWVSQNLLTDMQNTDTEAVKSWLPAAIISFCWAAVRGFLAVSCTPKCSSCIPFSCGAHFPAKQQKQYCTQ